MIDLTQKRFTIEPASDPKVKMAVAVRTVAIHDENLTHGAARLFALLIDLAFESSVFGVIVVSATQLAERLHCSRHSIFDWLRCLTLGNYLWVDKKYQPNFWALNRYHISALDPKDRPATLPTGESYGNGQNRPAAAQDYRCSECNSMVIVQKIRKVGERLVCVDCRGGSAKIAPQKKGVFAVSEQNAPEAIEKEHQTGAIIASEQSNNCTGPMQKTAPGKSKNLHAAEAMAAPVASEICTSPVKKSAHLKNLVKDLDRERTYKSKISSKGVKPAELIEKGTQFVNDLAEIAGKNDGLKAAMWQRDKFGKQWRARYEEDKEKAARVLAEVRVAAREGTITGKVGEYFNYIWNNFASRKAGK